MINKKILFFKKFYIYASLICMIFAIPVSYYGYNDLEVYQLGFFTLKTYLGDFSVYLNGYIDFYGPGVDLPIGGFPYLNPFNIFFNQPKIFFFLNIFFGLFIQIIFFKKILDFNKIKYENTIFIFLIFSIVNFNYNYSDDWPVVHSTFSLLFPTFYYFEKSLNLPKRIYIYKLFFWLSIQFLNAHLGILTNQYIFFFNFFSITKKIWNSQK